MKKPPAFETLIASLDGLPIRINRFLRPRWLAVVGGVLMAGSERHLTRFIYKLNAARKRPKRRRQIFGAPPPCGWTKWKLRISVYPR